MSQDAVPPTSDTARPPASLLSKYDSTTLTAQDAADLGRRISSVCEQFGVRGSVELFHTGPLLTTFEYRPGPGIKIAKVMSVAEDLALALASASVRIDRIPGRPTIGIELPNPKGGNLVSLRDVIESAAFQNARSPLTLALGKNTKGDPFIADLHVMPHLLIGGTTGSGKSVCLNTLILSIAFKATPLEVRLILIDPKMVELNCYAGLPHLLTPIITDPQKAANALKWVAGHMDERYKLFSTLGEVRNIDEYNQAVNDQGFQNACRGRGISPPSPLPYIVVVIDELADLMHMAPKETEESIVRIARMARAAGIHLIVATQRPSSDVITGSIKGNLPSRIAFKVTSRMESRVILDVGGAEQLLGHGDMLYHQSGTPQPVRVHGAFVSVAESNAVTRFWKRSSMPTEDTSMAIATSAPDIPSSNSSGDPLYPEASRLVVRERLASVSFLQRRFNIGFSRAGALLDQMDKDGLLGPQKGSKAREVLVPADFFDNG